MEHENIKWKTHIYILSHIHLYMHRLVQRKFLNYKRIYIYTYREKCEYTMRLYLKKFENFLILNLNFLRCIYIAAVYTHIYIHICLNLTLTAQHRRECIHQLNVLLPFAQDLYIKRQFYFIILMLLTYININIV